MNRKMFSLHSILPPAELKAGLDREVRVHNSLQKGRCRLALKWKSNNQFTVCMVEYEDLVGVECNGSVRSASRRRGAAYSAMLCGKIAPEGDGSVIVGHYRQLLAMWLLCAIAAGCFIGFAVTGQWLACLLTAALAVPLFYGLLRPERAESSGDLWDALEFLVATVEASQENTINIKE